MRKLSMLSMAHLAIAAQEAAEVRPALAAEVRPALKDPDGYYDGITFADPFYRFDKPKQSWQGQGKRKKPRVR